MQDLTTTTNIQEPASLAPEESTDCFHSPVPNYAVLFFDHLYSEFLTLRSKITDQNVIQLFEFLHHKRGRSELTWSDIYTFDLALVDQRPLENLIRKAYDARAKYRSIAGQKEFDEYLASKPPDLTTILIAPNNGQPVLAPPDAEPMALPPAPGEPPLNLPHRPARNPIHCLIPPRSFSVFCVLTSGTC